MPTITFDVPEKLAQQIASLPEAERNILATELFQDAFAEEETSAPVLTQAEIDDLKEAFADMDAGRVTRGETFFAELRSGLNLPPHPFGATNAKAKNGAL